MVALYLNIKARNRTLYINRRHTINSVTHIVKKHSSDSSSYLPELVTTRAKLGDLDTSTVTDTVSDLEESKLNKEQANLYKEVHDELGIGYITAAKEKHDQTISDWIVEDLEKLGKAFDKPDKKRWSAGTIR